MQSKFIIKVNIELVPIMENLKLVFFIIIYCSLSIVANAQNLVQNPSFELLQVDTSAINPYGQSLDKEILNWYSLGDGSTDVISLYVPKDSWSYAYPNTSTTCGGQQLPRTGKIIIGIMTYDGDTRQPFWREYVENLLISPLVIGQKYKVTFYVSLGDYSTNATNNMGVYFSKDQAGLNFRDGPGGRKQTYFPQIEFPEIITNTTDWVKLEAEVVATDAWEYMTIGNFRPNSSNHIIQNPNRDTSSTTYDNHMAYYFIDDVSVINICKKTKGFETKTCYESNPINISPITQTGITGWSDSLNPSKIISTSSSLLISPQKNTTYLLHSDACDLESYKVKVLGNLKVNLGNDFGIYPHIPHKINATYPNATYLWQDGSTNPIYEAKEAGKYWCTITDQYGCSKTDTINATMIILSMPNVFTPNDDGANDIFGPMEISGIKSTDLSIFNRWGELVYKTEDLYKWWDGADSEEGIYYWYIKYTDFYNRKLSQKGILSLIR